MLKKLLLLTLLCVGLNTTAFAAELKVGDSLPAITLKDQHDKAVTVAPDAQTLLFTVEKPASDLVNDYLKQQTPDFLTSKQAYFLADISGMPSMITKMFAIPKMQERPYTIVLGYEAADLAFMPRQKDHVTLVKVKAGKVDNILFIKDEAGLADNF
ncbi:hypothetical protein [Thiothrix subterranea]|uniref:FAD/FMN-containing dehydrogenase n=1 Tax=Thiothrix subterranea TaxID=2735563 RepID=A0AA51MLG4_9GAMM|nr:hypothetical protein [Thiothrix subterranea]MDQ5769904.1 hypothetical protein [Thiothrix subterranea]WML86070.1 hypothetical protein RCG00_17450 [Thiothrix subterranea]